MFFLTSPTPAPISVWAGSDAAQAGLAGSQEGTDGQWLEKPALLLFAQLQIIFCHAKTVGRLAETCNASHGKDKAAESTFMLPKQLQILTLNFPQILTVSSLLVPANSLGQAGQPSSCTQSLKHCL